LLTAQQYYQNWDADAPVDAAADDGDATELEASDESDE
jgi:hypothetical protein